MHFLHSRIAARRCFTGCVELHRMPAVRQLSSTSLRRDVDDDLASTTNEHLLPVLRAQLKLRQLRLEALDRGNRQMMERQKIPKLPSQRPQKNQRAIIEEFSTFIERIEQHPRRIERADQAKEVKGMTPAFMARLERILDGKVAGRLPRAAARKSLGRDKPAEQSADSLSAPEEPRLPREPRPKRVPNPNAALPPIDRNTRRFGKSGGYTGPNEHILPFLRGRLQNFHAIELEAHIELTKPRKDVSWERTLVKHNQTRQATNKKRIKAMTQTIEALERHPARIENMEQLAQVQGVHKMNITRIHRILDGDQLYPRFREKQPRKGDRKVSIITCPPDPRPEPRPPPVLQPRPEGPTTGIHRDEVEEMESWVRSLLHRDHRLHVCGAYRRGEEYSDKVVFCLRTEKSSLLAFASTPGKAKSAEHQARKYVNKYLDPFFKDLEERQLESEEGEMLCRSDSGAVFKFELHLAAPNTLGAALVCLTGDDEYVQSLQSHAKATLGATLTTKGFWAIPATPLHAEGHVDGIPLETVIKEERDPRQWKILDSPTEEGVLAYLGVEWKEPSERVGRAVGT